MKKVVLHIGTEKTGTTSIQDFCHLNREKLFKEHRILYPDFGYDSKAQFELVAALHPMCNSGKRAEFAPNVDYDPDKVWDSFCEQINTDEADICLVSVEHFSSRVNQDGISFIRDKLSSKLPDVKVEILVYLRNQVDMFQSSYSTYIKTGGDKSHIELVSTMTGKGFYYNFFNLCRMWINAFGFENVLVKNFDDVKSGLLDDLLNCLGVNSALSDFKVDSPSNVAWNPLFLEFARNLNASRLKDMAHGERYSLLSRFHSQNSRFNDYDDYSVLPEKLAREIESKFSESNANLAKLLGFESDESFFSTWKLKKKDYDLTKMPKDLCEILLDTMVGGENENAR